MIPGLDETLRVNGTAELVADPELCARFAIDDKPRRVVVVVTAACGRRPLRQAMRAVPALSSSTRSWLPPMSLPRRRAWSRAAAEADLAESR